MRWRLMTTGLPPGYNRDYQELKAVLFDTFDEIIELAGVMQDVVKGLVVNEHILQDKKYNDIFSVEEANRRVRKGVPFREAYRDCCGRGRIGNVRVNRNIRIYSYRQHWQYRQRVDKNTS
ncbi:MAG: hypothetical protein MZV63_51690 [Marinilabiliales bacterium]|nr:hypothetical protein [Marinilabiliales bacterium]